MGAWVLQICIGISWLGCGEKMTAEFPTAETCYVALRTMKVTGPAAVTPNAVAYCRPKDVNYPRVELDRAKQGFTFEEAK